MIACIFSGLAGLFAGCFFGFILGALLSGTKQDEAYRAGYSAGRLLEKVGRDKYDDLADDLWNFGGTDDE